MEMAELDAVWGAGARQRLRVGIRDHELNALQAGVDHVVHGVAAGAANAEHHNTWLQLMHGRRAEMDHMPDAPAPSTLNLARLKLYF